MSFKQSVDSDTIKVKEKLKDVYYNSHKDSVDANNLKSKSDLTTSESDGNENDQFLDNNINQFKGEIQDKINDNEFEEDNDHITL